MKLVLSKRPASPQYPAIKVLAEMTAQNGLIDEVCRIVHHLDLSDASAFSEPSRVYFRLVRQAGASKAIEAVLSLPDKNDMSAYLGKQSVLHNLGILIYDRLDDCVKADAFPYHNIDAIPVGNEFHVLIRAICHVGAVDGRPIFCSSRRPSLDVDGARKVVAFTDHAIERIGDRLVPKWRSYWGLADIFAFLADCTYFEPASLCPSGHNQQGLGFTFYNTCALEHFRPEILNVPCEYALRVIGFAALVDFRTKGTPWFYRVGYGSCFLWNDYLVARTLLFPGFRATPEHRMLMNSSLSEKEKYEMRRKAEHQRIEQLLTTQDYSLIKWFHDNGVPQVVNLATNPFAPWPE